MVQSGVYRGYPTQEGKVITELHPPPFYVYSDPNNPNYPGYTMVINFDGAFPEDCPYRNILFRGSWWMMTGEYHYFFYGGTFEINYVNKATRNIWVSGSSTGLSIGYVDDAVILYCQETDITHSVHSGNDGYIFVPDNISSMLQSGINHMMWFGYSGPQWFIRGVTRFYEDGGTAFSCGPMYFISLPKGISWY